MSKKNGILELVVTGFWFDKISIGEKKHEYRECKPYWDRILSEEYNARHVYDDRPVSYFYVRFRRGYQKNAPKMLFEIKDISKVWGKDTDLKVNKYVYDIELGERLK